MDSKTPFKRICVECGRHFATDRPDARYCSSDCRRAHFQARRGRSEPGGPGSPPRPAGPRKT